MNLKYKYTSKEVFHLSKLSPHEFSDLTRKHKDGYRFRATWAAKRGHNTYWSEEDLALLRRYRETKDQHQQVLDEMRSIAKQRSCFELVTKE